MNKQLLKLPLDTKLKTDLSRFFLLFAVASGPEYACHLLHIHDLLHRDDLDAQVANSSTHCALTMLVATPDLHPVKIYYRFYTTLMRQRPLGEMTDAAALLFLYLCYLSRHVTRPMLQNKYKSEGEFFFKTHTELTSHYPNYDNN